MHSFIPSLSFGFLVLSSLLGVASALSEAVKSPQVAANLAPISYGHQPNRRHTGHNARALRSRDLNSKNESVEAQGQLLYPGRRAAGAHFTFYTTGMGACGRFNSPDDLVVALNAQQWEGGAHCFAPITITIRGKTVGAIIVDKCEGCGFNNLDFTHGLFSQWAPAGPGGGALDGSWEYGSGAAPPQPSPSPSPSPSPTPSSSSATSASSTVSSSSSTAASSTSSAASLAPSSTPSSSVWDKGNIQQLNLAMMGIGGVLEATRVV